MRLGTALVLEKVRACAAEGLTKHEAAERLGIAYSLVARYGRMGGIKFRRAYRHLKVPDIKTTARTAVMIALHRNGYTLQQIGDQYSLTRERVRQILTKAGITKFDGGQQVTAAVKRQKKAAALDGRYLKKWGCSHAEWKRIGEKVRKIFRQQRSNASRRNIEWQLTFPQWWTIWQQSGHWGQRGRGQGYCMCRRGDAGPYSPDNVFIDLLAHNSSERLGKKSGLPIGVRKNKKYRGYSAHRQINGKKLHLGTFPTPELAHAAYLMAAAPARAA